MKDEILKKIDKAIMTEEKGVPIYARHIENTLFWSGLEPGIQEKFKKLFLKLKEDSNRHMKQLKYVKKILAEAE